MRLGRADKDNRGSVLYGNVSGADRPSRRSGWGLRDRDVLLKEPVVRKFWKLSLSSIMTGVREFEVRPDSRLQRARGSSGHCAVTARTVREGQGSTLEGKLSFVSKRGGLPVITNVQTAKIT